MDRCEKGARGDMQATVGHDDQDAASPPLHRRTIAVAFADIVGYSVLTAADEAGTLTRWLALLRDHVAPAATRFGGAVVDRAGDGVLARFPDMTSALAWSKALHAASAAAVEADPERAPITFRVALHLGEVLEGPEGIFGDAVNLAARLQEYGSPGGTVVSAAAAAALPAEALTGARDLGELPLRNLSRSVRAFSLDARRPVAVPLPPPPARLPSIAVLPLENLSRDPEDDYLAEGVVEDVISSLAALQEVFVIARDSTRMFVGQRPTPQRVGRTLGVRYVLTGSLRRAGDRAQVAVQLADAETGATLWGDRYTAGREDIFALQEQVVERIVAGIAPEVQAAALAEAMRKRPENLTAYDLTLRGLHALGAPDREGFAAARVLLQRAIDEDPGFAPPRAWAARWHSLNIGRGWSTDRAADNAAAMQLAERAIALDPANALALATYGHLTAYLRHDCDTAMDCFTRALAASPNSAVAWTLSSSTLNYLGRSAEAVAHAERGLRLSPYDPLRFLQHHVLAAGHYGAGDLEQAERLSRMSIASNPDHASSWRIMAAVLGAQGRLGEAQDAVQRILALEPAFRLRDYAASQLPVREPILRARMLDDMRRAGLPD